MTLETEMDQACKAISFLKLLVENLVLQWDSHNFYFADTILPGISFGNLWEAENAMRL